MDYVEFTEHRKQCLHDSTVLIDAGDMNLYDKFSPIETYFTDTSGGHKGDNIHRCHLVEDFLRFYELDDIIDKRHVGYSEGVRQSLSVIMELWKDKAWLIAGDNYPYYTYKAKKTGLKFHTFDTLESNLDVINNADNENTAGNASSEVLLLTYPLKPSGMDYTQQDWLALETWLQEGKERHIIIDAVYAFDLKDEAELFRLFVDTRQVTILYSLSKAFAAPGIAGFTFSYDDDIREALKGLSKDDAKMRLCYLIFNKNSGRARRQQVSQTLCRQYYKAMELGLIQDFADIENMGGTPGYLFYVHDGLPVAHDTLVIPASVYGSDRHGYIVSTLGL